MENIKELVRKHDHGKKAPYAEVTRAAINYIHSVKCYGWGDEEHVVYGVQDVKWVKVTVMVNNRTDTVWSFRTIKDMSGKIGYRVNSWRNQFDRQVSKEDGNIAFLMIMEKAKEVKGAKVIVETII